jgi:hypothetical protein
VDLTESVKRAIILSLFITYNCRLDTERRKAHWHYILKNSTRSSIFPANITEAEIPDLIQSTQNLATEFIHTPGEDKETRIALNESFIENLFIAFVCVLNKIALYIVGKPGTSKSLHHRPHEPLGGDYGEPNSLSFDLGKTWEGIYKNFGGFFRKILTKKLVALPLVLQKLKSLGHTPKVIFGTKFSQDLSYFTISKNLRKIVMAMVKGTIVILIDPKSLYSPL